MSRKDKLIARILRLPSDFHYDELKRLLAYFDYTEASTGKTSGSRVVFEHPSGRQIRLHRPHPGGILKVYQLKQIISHLEL